MIRHDLQHAGIVGVDPERQLVLAGGLLEDARVRVAERIEIAVQLVADLDERCVVHQGRLDDLAQYVVQGSVIRKCLGPERARDEAGDAQHHGARGSGE